MTATNLIEPYIETRHGVQFHFLDPKPDEILIEDIAYALANQCRFNGHCNQFYSVAEHSVLVAALVPQKYKLAALLHDASEAYLSDIPSPIKQYMPEYAKIELLVQQAIDSKFGIDSFHEEVKKADRQQLCTEAYNLLPSQGKDWGILQGIDFKEGKKPMNLTPVHAFGLFMNVFVQLSEPKIIIERD